MGRYHDLLEVPVDATLEEIKAAYRKKVKETHPDVSPGNVDLFLEIIKAYSILSDEEKRRHYEETGIEPEDNQTMIEAQAKTILLELLVTLFTKNEVKRVLSTDFLQILHNSLNGEIKSSKASIAKAYEDAKYYRLLYKRVQRKEKDTSTNNKPESLYHTVITDILTNLNNVIKYHHFRLKTISKAIQLLNEYEYILPTLIEKADDTISENNS